jgi:hypothetical protein
MADDQKAKEFYLWDYDGTLFPMETCRVLIENSSEEISSYIKRIGSDKEKEYCFLPQETVYSSKTQRHPSDKNVS